MFRFILISFLFVGFAEASVYSCKKFEISINVASYNRTYFIKTMSADIVEVKKRKATLIWDSKFKSKKWRIDRELGLIKIKSKDLRKVFESYESSTSSARYVQMMNFVEDYEDEDDFRFSPHNESAPFIGHETYPNSVGEFRVAYTYSDCN